MNCKTFGTVLSFASDDEKECGVQYEWHQCLLKVHSKYTVNYVVMAILIYILLQPICGFYGIQTAENTTFSI